ncbi:uncharacterized protein [Onthophagus taurus]|uniref:uncharacterized protein n=1 Tax=Onthophagus taurus TaxID=166361 RepID=UPI0039BDC069
MCRIVIISLILCPFLAIIVSSKPIMVSFGTNQGPIIPIQRSTTLRPPPSRIDVANSAPAPVFERPDDIPNPATYRALIPHQYRRKIYSHKPHPNLLLGTPVDIKYTGRFDRRKELKRQIKSLGTGYTGPQVFEKQEYEYELEKKNDNFGLRRNDEGFTQQNQETYQRNFVPQIGIVYSSGLRYYIPQIDYSRSEEDSNSVYDRDDSRYQDDRVYQNNQQKNY